MQLLAALRAHVSRSNRLCVRRRRPRDIDVLTAVQLGSMFVVPNMLSSTFSAHTRAWATHTRTLRTFHGWFTVTRLGGRNFKQLRRIARLKGCVHNRHTSARRELSRRSLSACSSLALEPVLSETAPRVDRNVDNTDRVTIRRCDARGMVAKVQGGRVCI